MKRAIILLWKGLTGIIAATANWFTVILGMQDESKYGKFIRRVVGGSFALIMLLLAGSALSSCIDHIRYKYWAYNFYHTSSYTPQYLSRNATYYSQEYQTDGYVETRDGKKTVKDIHWIAKPLGNDSLVCYSNGVNRGYFNMLTGELAIKPQYRHAWVFSDGLASVDDNGWIKFIDTKGDVAIDPKIPYITGADGYVFHNGHCVLHNDRRDKFGMIDKHGNWVMKAEYDNIQPVDTFWIASKRGKQCVIKDDMKVIIPFIDADLYISGGKITAEMADHTLRTYDLQGNITDAFLISGVENMVYETGELRYLKTNNGDEEGNMIGETEDLNPTPIHKTSRCKRYEAANGWYGLMSPEGKVLTNPNYSEITAISYDLYLCKNGSMSGEVLNGRGMKVR